MCFKAENYFYFLISFKINILDKKFLKSVRGWGTPHRPIFSTCIETTLKIGAILMKFTQDVCMDEKIF